MPLRPAAAFLLLALLLGGSGALSGNEESWVEVRSPHYSAVSNAGEAEARAALRQFEAIREVFRKVLPEARTETGRPLTLVVLQDETSMRRFAPGPFEGQDPSRPAGRFLRSQDMDFAILRLDVQHQDRQPYFTLYHEFAHGIIHGNLGHVPAWLDEGIADFYGATEIRRDRVRIGQVPEARLDRLRRSALLPAEVFFTVDRDSPHYRQAGKTSLFYAQSWAAVHYLLMDPGAVQKGLLGRLVQALEEVSDPLAAHRRAFGDLPSFIAALRTYARQPSFRFHDYDLALAPDDRGFAVRGLGRAEVLVLEAEALQRSGQPERARAPLKEALDLAPGLGRAHLGLGYQAFQERSDGPARAHLLEAQRLDGQDFRTPYYLAALALRGAGEEAAVPLRLLERCLALNPGFAPAHSLYGLALLRDPDGRARALAASRRAVELEPATLAFRANLGEVCLALGEEAQAARIAEGLKTAARTPEERRMADSFARELAEHQNHRRREAEHPATPSGASVAGPPPGIQAEPVRRSLKFRLPEKYQGLGRAVLARVAEGREQDAITLVKGALAQASGTDRKALQDLLAQLRGIPAGPR